MLNNQIIDWSELISFSASGLSVADYVQIRSAVTKRFKEIYGEDIDVSTASVDGIYLENYCLIINNILQAFKTLYSGLDVNEAAGKQLDILAALTNVYRQQATFSKVALTVTLDENEAQAYVTDSISFVDINGNEWIARASDYQLSNFTFEPAEPVSLIATCKQLGPIEAQAGTMSNNYEDGWVNKTLALDVIMKVQQFANAEVGSSRETDAELRARRQYTIGTSAPSVLESLVGALYKFDGIRDVHIYNNVATGGTAKDGTPLIGQSIYIVIRKLANTLVSDNMIGTAIYENLTPGIPTLQKGSGSSAVQHSFTYTQYFFGEQLNIGTAQTVYWSEATAIHPQIQVKLNNLNYFSDSTTPEKVAKALLSYANNLSLGKDLTVLDIMSTVSLADPLFRGQPTFSIEGVYKNNQRLDIGSVFQISPETYFDYNHYSFSTNDGVTTILIDYQGA